MDEARNMFEGLLKAKGKDIPRWDGKRYNNPNIQTYWRWFALGWNLRKGG